MEVVGVDWRFAIIVKVDTHNRKMDLLVVYTNEPILVENSINTMKQLLAQDDKCKVVSFNLEYTDGRAGYDQKVAVAKSCMHHHVVVYHYCMARRP
ncbi:hypothetical protein D1007_49813 [Hordeum vulgare]|nr:hypothetical protein D1007_49813 [Hordeum vulgare]